MFVSHYIAASGGDLFPLVIIVVAILAQIIKAAKGPKPTITQPGQQHADDGGFSAPQDELKKFLESLTGGTTTTAAEIPPPVPQPAPKPQPRIIKAQQPARPAVVSRSKTTAPAEMPYVIATPDTAVAVEAFQTIPEQAKCQARNLRPTLHTHKEAHHFRSLIACQLSNRDSLRNAILLREILGPCLALRRAGTGAPGL
jgi:hypothetical protein